jgi:predicted ribosome quality control (RQC) complex YloA/Tae2 family protein
MLLLVTLGSGAVLHAADDPAPPAGRPTREEIRESFKNLTPEERAARLKAIRDNGGPAAEALLKRRAELEKLREATRDLPPAQREARIREWRETNALSRPLATMSPEERDAKRKLFQKRIEEQIATLNKKKADGTITEDETRRLQNMERMRKRLESGPVLSSPRPRLGLPPPAATDVKPAKPDSPVKPD